MAEQKTAEPKSVGQWLFNAFKLIGFILLIQTPLMVIVIFMNLDDKYDFPVTVTTVLATIGLMFIGGMIWFVWNRYYTYAKEKVQKIRWKDIKIAILFFVAARILVLIGTNLNRQIYGVQETENDMVINNLTDENTPVALFLLFILAIGVLIPILEELTLRGIFTNLIFTKRMFWLPLIVTSLVFGSLHLSDNILSFALYALLGTIFYLAYIRRRNIVDAMLVHIFHNGLTSVAMLFLYFAN